MDEELSDEDEFKSYYNTKYGEKDLYLPALGDIKHYDPSTHSVVYYDGELGIQTTEYDTDDFDSDKHKAAIMTIGIICSLLGIIVLCWICKCRKNE